MTTTIALKTRDSAESTAGRPAASPLPEGDISEGDKASPVDLPVYTGALVEALRLTMGCAGASRFLCDTMERQVRAYLSLACERDWSSAVKYLLAYPKADFLRNERPKTPSTGRFEPRGPLRRWIRQRTKCFNRQNIWLWDTWLQGCKKALLPLSSNMIIRSQADHRINLTQEDVCSYVDAKEILNNRDVRTLLGSVRRHLVDLKYLTDRDWVELCRNTPPSEKACFEQPRGKKGQVGGALRELRLQCLEQLDFCIGREYIPPGFKDPERLCFQDRNLVIYPTDDEFRGEPMWGEPHVRPGGGLCAPEEQLTFKLTSVSEDLIIDYLEDDFPNDDLPDLELIHDDAHMLECMVASVLEPNKVRNVSKGEAREYHRSRPYQEQLLGTIRRMPAFQFTGKEVDPVSLAGVGPPRKGYSYFSVDFSAATDSSSQNVGMEINRDLTEGLPTSARHTILRVFGLHHIHYPSFTVAECPRNPTAMQEAGKKVQEILDMFTEEELDPNTGIVKQDMKSFKHRETGEPWVRFTFTVKSARQKTGQLMGSPVSFPILCLINASAYLKIMRYIEYWSRVRSDLPASFDPEKHVVPGAESTKSLLDRVRINGDDCVYLAPDWAWDLAIRIYGRYGLKMSVGKAYKHPNYLQINSKSYEWKEGDVAPTFVPYMNVGLYYGRHKVQGREEGKTAVDALGEVLDGTPLKHRKRVAATYLNLHQETISRECLFYDEDRIPRSRNLWLPRSLGGMGLTAPQDFSWDIDLWQQRLASQLMRKHSNWDSQYPLRGFEPYGREQAVHVFAESRLEGSEAKRTRLEADPGVIRRRTLRQLAGCHAYFPLPAQTGPPIFPTKDLERETKLEVGELFGCAQTYSNYLSLRGIGSQESV